MSKTNRRRDPKDARAGTQSEWISRHEPLYKKTVHTGYQALELGAMEKQCEELAANEVPKGGKG